MSLILGFREVYGADHVVRTTDILFAAGGESNHTEASPEIDGTIQWLSDPTISAADATFNCTTSRVCVRSHCLTTSESRWLVCVVHTV